MFSNIRFLLTFLFFGLFSTFTIAHEEEQIKVAVVGDTGIGERAYQAGYLAVRDAMHAKGADVLLHLGDFVYQPDLFPSNCPDRYINEIKSLAKPFPVRLFVAGDNDLPPQKWKPKASGCWEKTAPLATPFDTPPATQSAPGALEGATDMGPALFLVLNVYDWEQPKTWVVPHIKRARESGKWIIVALHEPPITTAWYLKKRRPLYDELKAMGADLILSGNQHSYERFSPLGRRHQKDEITTRYKKGEGPVSIVSGGGGATFKPFADLQDNVKRTAPQDVFAALEKRALMNHFLILEIGHDALKGSVYRVCPGSGAKGNPRWRAGKDFWNNIKLPCDGQPAGVDIFDRFEIREPGEPGSEIH